MSEIDLLKADMDVKREAYKAAVERYNAAMCAKSEVQPGDILEVDKSVRSGSIMQRRTVTKRYRVTRLQMGYSKPEIMAVEILKSGAESHVERNIWRDYRKVSAEVKP